MKSLLWPDTAQNELICWALRPTGNESVNNNTKFNCVYLWRKIEACGARYPYPAASPPPQSAVNWWPPPEIRRASKKAVRRSRGWVAPMYWWRSTEPQPTNTRRKRLKSLMMHQRHGQRRRRKWRSRHLRLSRFASIRNGSINWRSSRPDFTNSSLMPEVSFASPKTLNC